MKNAAIRYLKAGLCVLPADRAQKRPTVGSWKRYQKRLPTKAELSAWFANGPDAVCLLCGPISGNQEMIDFDHGGELMDAWAAKIPPDLLTRLVIESTQSGGWHVDYRYEGEPSGNMKLAQGVRDSKLTTLIETRGEGGLFLCAPTEGYELMQGDLTAPPLLTAEERDLLLNTARELDECVPDVINGPPMSGHNPHQGEMCEDNSHMGQMSADHSHSGQMCEHNSHMGHICAPGDHTGPLCGPSHHMEHTCVPGRHMGRLWEHNAEKPGNDFNSRGDVRGVLQDHGWVRTKAGENEHWRRPGKEKGTSATFNGEYFYVFSSNAPPFEPNRAYSPFAVLALLEHNGDFSAATRALSAEGFGQSPQAATGADISAIVGVSADNSVSSPPPPPIGETPEPELPQFIDAAELCQKHTSLHRPIIYGLLREGETMNLIAAPKTGKSWLATDLAMTVALGRKWLGAFETNAGDVLIIDNELHAPTLGKRLRDVAAALGIDTDSLTGRLTICSLRGSLRDLRDLLRQLGSLEPGRFKLIILDAFYRFMPTGTDENDNGTMAQLYNMLDHCAAAIGCAFVLIHHTTKGGQSTKAVTDVGAGAGAQSRASDTHVVLRRHREAGVVVLDAAVRSWPPVRPLCLRLQHPVWTPADDLDPEELEGARQKSKKDQAAPTADGMTAEMFVERFVPDERVTKATIVQCAKAGGFSGRQIDEFMDQAEGLNLIYRHVESPRKKHQFSRLKPACED